MRMIRLLIAFLLITSSIYGSMYIPPARVNKFNVGQYVFCLQSKRIGIIEDVYFETGKPLTGDYFYKVLVLVNGQYKYIIISERSLVLRIK